MIGGSGSAVVKNLKMRPWETINMKTGLIYKLTSKTTNKIYIGQTINLRNRIRKHKHDKFENPKRNSLQYDLNRYGFDDFDLEIIEDNIPQTKLHEREKYWIKKLNTIKNGYNIAIGGQGGNTYEGFTVKEKHDLSKKLSNSKIGNKNPMRIHGSKLKGEKNGMYGKTPHNVREITIENVITGKQYTFTSHTECAKFLGYKHGHTVSAWVNHKPTVHKKSHKLVRY